MRSFKIKLVAPILALVLTLCGVFASCALKSNRENRNSYSLVCEIDENILKCTESVQIVSPDDGAYFCLYPNAFKDESKTDRVAVAELFNEAYPNGFDEGFLEITSVTEGKKELQYSFEEDEQLLYVPGRHQNISITFSEKLPYSPCRYGYGESTYNFCSWYPILCPKINGEIKKSVYNSYGDPFCSECADYSVTITASSLMRLASSGEITSCDKSNPLKSTWQVKGENIRDFAFVLSEKFSLCSKRVGDTLVYSYYTGEDEAYGQAALNYACDALEIYGELYGAYPYGTYSVVCADFYIGGMEYPNLALISNELYSEEKLEALEETVVHETAHQWFYGIVGNDEINEPWLDEGLTEYSVGLYYEKQYSRERYDEFITSNSSYCKIIFSVFEDKVNNAAVNTKTTDFDSFIVYNAVVYDYASLMLASLRRSLGDKAFFEMLKTYVNDNMYSVATAEDFLSTAEKTCGGGTKVLIKTYLSEKVSAQNIQQ